MPEERNGNGKKISLNGGFLALCFVGIQLVIVLVNLIASSGYTPKADFTALKDEFAHYRESNERDLGSIRNNQTGELGKIAVGINELNAKMKDNDRQDADLKDHENRIRVLEGRPKR